MKQKLFCLLFFSTILYAPLSAQRLRFTQLGVQQGLPASEVYNLFQDNKGYVWAFTEYGMAKHNGIRFVPSCRNLPFNESIVYAVRKSPQGEIYVANSKARIYLIKNDRAYPVHGFNRYADTIPGSNNEVIYDMQVNDSSDIYLSSYKKSYHYQQGKIMLLTAPGYADTGKIYLQREGTGFAAILKSRSMSDRFFITISDTGRSRSFTFPFPAIGAWGDRARLSTDSRFYYVQSKENLTRISMDGKEIRVAPVSGIMTTALSPEGYLWIGTKKGLYVLDVSLKVIGHYFENCIVSDILFDRNDGAWVSTIEQGVFYCRNTKHLFYDNIPQLSGNISMLKNLPGGLFIGTANGKLMLMSAGGIKHLNMDSNLFAVKDICEFNGEYLVGTKGSLKAFDHRLNMVERKFVTLKGYPVNGYGLMHHSPDSFLLITGSAIVWVNRQNYNRISPGNRTGDNTRCVIRRNTHEYLVGTSNGLVTITDTTPDAIMNKQLQNIVITKIRRDYSNNIWICTKGNGLYILSPDNRIRRFEKCPSDVIHDITFDNHGLILLCTNKGFYHYKLRHNGKPSSWIRVLDIEVLACETYGDKVFIATTQGLISLDKATLSDEFNPPFFLESVVANNARINLNDIKLAHYENELYFNFELLSYDNPDCSFQYHLYGPHRNEYFSGSNQLHLQNLAPGYYTLHTYALDHTGNTSFNSPIRVHFYIQPAFWQTHTFLVLVIAAGVGIIALLIWLISRKFKLREQRKAIVMKELAENRLTALKSQINPHFISNSLTAIQHLVFDNEIDRANEYIAQFSLLIRYALDHSDKVLTSLSNEIKVIEIVVALEQLRFSDKFVFETLIDPGIDTHKIFIPPLITQPIIENAIWHGLLPLRGLRKPRLILSIQQSNERMIISIIDNGVGRFSKKHVQAGRESKGTRLINSWIENLNKLFPANSVAIQTIDLYHENNPTGTQVDIVLNREALNNLQDDKRYSPQHNQMHYY